LAETEKSDLQDRAVGHIKFEYRRIDQLKLNPKNPRVQSRMQIRQLARSIKAFGFCVPVGIDRDSNVIMGHGRIRAAKQVGITEIPTISLEHLSDSQVKALTIADNRLNETSTWNEQLLAEQLKELSLLDLDFDIDATGFEIGEIDLRIEGLSNSEQVSEDRADAIPVLQNQPIISKPGYLWLLRRHRVYCASALELNSYNALMEEQRAAMVFTDPPYNVPIAGHVGGLGSIHHREFQMASGELTSAEFAEFLTRICKFLGIFGMPGTLVYVCMDWRHLSELLAAGHAALFELKNICIWVKSNAGMGSFYRSQHELVLVFKSGKAPHRNNIQLGQFGRHRTNVWHYAASTSFSRNTDEGNLLALHPTVKPVALVADAIMDSTTRGDIVLDCFLGSGSTVIAAERTGRHCYGLELDPIYIDTVVRRWQAYTGEAAVLSSTGETFDDLAKQAGGVA
jgi:DNA modification methylase